jgi:plastocyanin
VKLKRFLFPIVALVVVFAFTSASDPPTALAAQVWNVSVGGGGQGIAANGFFPGPITIHTGDTIHFQSPYLEIHTLTSLPPGMAVPMLIAPGPAGPPQFGFNPIASTPTFTGSGTQSYDPSKYFNSGILNQNDVVNVSFANAGTFTFLCLVHGFIDPTTNKLSGMKLDVTVVPQGSPGPTSQAQLDAQGNTQRDAFIQLGLQARAGFTATSSKLANGSTNWGVHVGGYGDLNGQADILRFTQEHVNVNVGDTITWTNDTFTPHTVTFLSGSPDIPLITPIPGAAGSPPFLSFTPAAFLPAGGPTYDGTVYSNSGFIGNGGPPRNTFALTFTKPGTYAYICHLHDQEGMMGTVTVSGVAAASTSPAISPSSPTGIAAPNTGTGASGTNASWLPALILSVVVGATLVASGLRMHASTRS